MCPHCKSLERRVLNRRKTTEGVGRCSMCTKCGKIYYTIETICTPEVFHAIWNKYDTVKRLEKEVKNGSQITV